MYAQLGNIKFESAKGFTSLEETFGMNYAQHDRIKGKPRLEAVGANLDTVNFSMYLHSQFTTPEDDIEQMRVNMVNNEILPLVLGNGKVVGSFVITNFSVTTMFTDPVGNLIESMYLAISAVIFFPLYKTLNFGASTLIASKVVKVHYL